MAHHDSTPASVLNAPELVPVIAWHPHERFQVGTGRRATWRDRGPFRGSVAAMTGDPRAAQLAGRRKARHRANVAAKRAGTPRVRVEMNGVDVTRHIVPGSVRRGA